MQHLICLKHLLTSLGKSPFSYQIGNLVTATNKKDFDSLLEIYLEKWNSIEDQKEQQKMKRLLKKVGLSIENGSILINEERWTEVSMMRRSKFRMLSCTNQLESTYGHLNSGIPRRNSFWTSIKHLIEAIKKRKEGFHYVSNIIIHILKRKRKI